ncbi:unnamed protein product [Acanthosepion pharaonis]|uniref:Major facilitator superfamily (MFS) profile domain-containing protein n=1 Tax=Acanthosepion pharaonis TaxID=158019 RepID=A0A812AL93_ACAPH|nr:unnamed protein product [Sepia pharaonis]
MMWSDFFLFHSTFVNATFVTVILLCPLAGALTSVYGCKKVTVTGSILTAFGFILSIFATDVYYLYFSFGILGGLGIGLVYLPAIVCVGFYFEKRRAFATGLAVCGAGVGTFIFAPLTQFLLEKYNWKGAVLIESGLMLNCIICGLFFRSLPGMEGSQKENPKKPAKKDLANIQLNGVYISITSVVLVDLLGLEKLTNSFGLTLLFQGVATLLGPPAAGWLFDATHIYDYSFYLAGLSLGVGGLMQFFIPQLKRYHESKNTRTKPTKPNMDYGELPKIIVTVDDNDETNRNAEKSVS